MAHQCKGKVRHKSKEVACIVASKQKNVAMNVYLCPSCKFWHLGNTNDPARRANRITQLLERDKRDQQKRLNGQRS
jgi:hypothetical protein